MSVNRYTRIVLPCLALLGLSAVATAQTPSTAQGQLPGNAAIPAASPAACTPEGCYTFSPDFHDGSAQHTYRFALLKKWFHHEEGVPIYGWDNHPDVPLTYKTRTFCTPAVDPKVFYETQQARW
jgi:hypothetical protein